MEGRFISYCRVSTNRQGRSGLGLAAQQQAVKDFLNGGNWKLLAGYTEVESGKDDDRPQLEKALRHAKVTGSRLLVAKLDRLSRNLGFIAHLQESKVPFTCCDMPDANELTIHLFGAIAQHERKAISSRTKAALAAKRERLAKGLETTSWGGNRLGGPNGGANLRGLGNAKAVAALKATANERASDMAEIIKDIQDGGIVTTRAIAAELNERGIQTARGGPWRASSVSDLLKRLRQNA